MAWASRLHSGSSQIGHSRLAYSIQRLEWAANETTVNLAQITKEAADGAQHVLIL